MGVRPGSSGSVSVAVVLLLGWVVAVVLTSHASGASDEQDPLSSLRFDALRPTTPEAYISLLYNDAYALPSFVLIHTLRASGSIRDIVILVTREVTEPVRDGMRRLGAQVMEVPIIQNPYAKDRVFQKRFAAVLTKLLVFRFDIYRRLAYVDSDVMVRYNIDDLFGCPGEFCAAFINPCIFNSGVMVFSPSKGLFDHMMKMFSILPSYDGGDQGFLNEYYQSLLESPLYAGHRRLSELLRTGSPEARAHMKVPTIPRTDQWRKYSELTGIIASDEAGFFAARQMDIQIADGYQPVPAKYYRLPFEYHVDAAFFYMNFAYVEDSSKARLAEFLGLPFIKPWFWWSHIMFDVSWEWTSFRYQLPSDLAGISGQSAALLVFWGILAHAMLASLALLSVLKPGIFRRVVLFMPLKASAKIAESLSPETSSVPTLSALSSDSRRPSSSNISFNSSSGVGNSASRPSEFDQKILELERISGNDSAEPSYCSLCCSSYLPCCSSWYDSAAPLRSSVVSTCSRLAHAFRSRRWRPLLSCLYALLALICSVFVSGYIVHSDSSPSAAIFCWLSWTSLFLVLFLLPWMILLAGCASREILSSSAAAFSTSLNANSGLGNSASSGLISSLHPSVAAVSGRVSETDYLAKRANLVPFVSLIVVAELTCLCLGLGVILMVSPLYSSMLSKFFTLATITIFVFLGQAAVVSWLGEHWFRRGSKM